MRQSFQALCVVTFDAPAETDVYHLHDIVADALISGSHATVSPTEVSLMSLREEAAMFNSNGDQWESDPDKPWDQIGRAHVELQSLMRISYAVFCLQTQIKHRAKTITH